MHTRAKFSILAATMAVGISFGGQVAHAEGKTISGRWIMPDNSILTIRGSDWSHPAHGAATISRQAGASIRVSYHAHQGTVCKYRVSTTAGGDVLVLEAADASQPLDFCPSGRFSRAD